MINRVINNRLTRPVFRDLIAVLVKSDTGLRLLNNLWCKLSYQYKSLFHYLAGNAQIAPANFEWRVQFAGAETLFPIRAGIRTDFELALASLGHDIEVKWIYQQIQEQVRLDCFVDIGANFGTHSILFLSNGIRCLSFEPNPACHPYFHFLLATNNIEHEIEGFALSNQHSFATFSYPTGETWLGHLEDGRN